MKYIITIITITMSYNTIIRKKVLEYYAGGLIVPSTAAVFPTPLHHHMHTLPIVEVGMQGMVLASPPWKKALSEHSALSKRQTPLGQIHQQSPRTATSVKMWQEDRQVYLAFFDPLLCYSSHSSCFLRCNCSVGG